MKGTLPGTYEIPNLVASPAGPYSPGQVVTLTATLIHPMAESEDLNNRNINWGGDARTSEGGLTIIDEKTFQRTATITIPDFVPTPTVLGDKVQLQKLSINGASSGSTVFGLYAGDTISLSTYYLYQQPSSVTDYNKINWSVTTGTTNTCPGYATFTPATTTAGLTASSGTLTTWKIPAYCNNPPVGATDPTISISLDASAGSNYSVPGLTYPGALTSTILIKPDGTQVTAADADLATSSSGLFVLSSGRNDIRNWIRAASHARFASGSRTIDIPIPWAMLDRTSAGNPLSTIKIKDRVIESAYDANGNLINTPYGSDLDIETDRGYRIENASNGTFSMDTSGTMAPSTPIATGTWVYLNSVAYRPSYIAWLFNGKYQSSDSTKPYYTTDGTLTNKYIVYNAANSATALAGHQADYRWGMGFGPSDSGWGTFSVPSYDLDGAFKEMINDEASKYRIPAVTRLQACKKASIQTWIAHQAKVYWAFRFLDPPNEAAAGTNTFINNNSRTTTPPANPETVHADGNASGWVVLNNTKLEGVTSTSGNSVKGMNRIASLFANGGTPLTYAMARTLAQFTDPASIFNDVTTPDDISQCANHFLVLFTDGIDNNGTGTNNGNQTTPYLTGSGPSTAFDAKTGNQAIITNNNIIDRNGSNWNLFTFAGIGAHMANPLLGTVGTDYLAPQNPGTSPRTDVPSGFLPFSIYKRNGVNYDKPHRITTMTVGVSLAGKITDVNSPKRSLFLAAVLGDQATTGGLLSGFRPFSGNDNPLDPNNDWIPYPGDEASYPAIGQKKPGAVYFFDATDPDKLSKSLDYALRLAISAGGNNATSSPNLPYVGATFGNQVYLGNFAVPSTGGVIWSGDLMMFGTRDTGTSYALVDKDANITTDISKTKAVWAASDALSSVLWSSRKLYTRLPGTAAVPERGLKPFTTSGPNFDNALADDNTSGLKNYVATTLIAGSTDQKKVMWMAAGADTKTGAPVDGLGVPTSNRATIMGDIVNSSPSALEYDFTDSRISSGIASHSRLAGVAGANRFRLILVGTNQGWVHAFGEVTKKEIKTDSHGIDQEIVTGAVQELWSFMPTDFLTNLDYVYGQSAGNNPHRFMADGTPTLYFLDLPSGGVPPNGKVNPDPTNKERAIAVVGLRKGGRSYYALDVKDPFNPTLKWSLVPDEVSLLTSDRNKTTMTLDDLKTLVGSMGFSTSVPAIGRVAFTSGTTTNLRDAVFLGGGLSTPDVDVAFTKPLGRSVLAVDVYTGEILSAAKLDASAGPVGAGIVPFQFIPNSGMAQRAYFTDQKGGLWAWGSRKGPDTTSPTYATYKNFRMDSSNLSQWLTPGGNPGIRKVYQDTSLAKNSVYTTLPAPFRVGLYPGRAQDNVTVPAAVGIAMVSGNRHNPLDFLYPNESAKPNQHRLTVVFDRQDSKEWGLDMPDGVDAGIQDNQLKDFTNNTVSTTSNTPCSDSVWKDITTGCSNFFLSPATGTPAFGYYVNFPFRAVTENYVAKGINPPMVVAGSLFYTYFLPTKGDPCSGGTGKSFTKLIADVMQPIVKDSRTGILNPSGDVFAWIGVASDLINYGTRGVIQAGTVPAVNAAPGAPQTTPEVRRFEGNPSEKYPKPRVWRTVH
ncbi:MAG: hypothetical protein LWX11_05135 [Firmicutes bacterium]|nr:hypothetical protein [Bacillota bacterium]